MAPFQSIKLDLRQDRNEDRTPREAREPREESPKGRTGRASSPLPREVQFSGNFRKFPEKEVKRLKERDLSAFPENAKKENCARASSSPGIRELSRKFAKSRQSADSTGLSMIFAKIKKFKRSESLKARPMITGIHDIS